METQASERPSIEQQCSRMEEEQRAAERVESSRKHGRATLIDAERLAIHRYRADASDLQEPKRARTNDGTQLAAGSPVPSTDRRVPSGESMEMDVVQTVCISIATEPAQSESARGAPATRPPSGRKRLRGKQSSHETVSCNPPGKRRRRRAKGPG